MFNISCRLILALWWVESHQCQLQEISSCGYGNSKWDRHSECLQDTHACCFHVRSNHSVAADKRGIMGHWSWIGQRAPNFHCSEGFGFGRFPKTENPPKFPSKKVQLCIQTQRFVFKVRETPETPSPPAFGVFCSCVLKSMFPDTWQHGWFKVRFSRELA